MEEYYTFGVILPRLIKVTIVHSFLVDGIVNFMLDEGALEGILVFVFDVGNIFDGKFFFVNIIVLIKKKGTDTFFRIV